MGRYLLARLAWAVPIVLAILIINFLIVHLVPGDPVQALVGDFPTPPGYIEQVRQEFGLDQPISHQLGLYLWNLAQGNLGFSFANRQPVLGLILDRARLTLLLMLPALTLAAMLGVVFALAAAPHAGSGYDSTHDGPQPHRLLRADLLARPASGHSVRHQARWLPAQGMITLRNTPTGWAAVWDVLWHLVLPALSVTIFYTAIVARVARASLLETISQDYVLTARAKGLSRRAVLWRHVLPNSLIPVVTVIGYNFGYSLTGAILVETVFAWPGLGSLFITSIGNRDYPVLQGIFLFTAITVVIANVLTDMLYGVLDPRVRMSQHAHA